MSRVIQVDSAGKERARLSRAVVAALREMARQSGPTAEARDLAAFIVLALAAIARGIESSAAAWEKRDYWVKADAFRRDWAWTNEISTKMKTGLFREDWAQVARLAAQVAQHLGKVKVSPRHRMGRPWQGAWKQLRDARD